MARSGYWKFHRKMWDWPWSTIPSHLVVWCWLLSEAQFQVGKSVLMRKKRIYLKPGQLTCGSLQIAEATGVPPSTVRRIIKLLKNEQQIEHQTDNHKSMITILKWKDYQGDEQHREQPVSNKRATSEQPVSTTEESNNTRMEEGKKGLVPTGPTPSQSNIEFFSNPEKREPVIQFFIKKGLPEKVARDEVTKFVLYWTEPTPSGKKVLWQQRETFDVKRRLVTWFLKVDKRFGPNSNNKINHLPKVVKI